MGKQAGGKSSSRSSSRMEENYCVESTKMKMKMKMKKKKNLRRLSEVKTLGNELLSSRKHINNLTILLSYISQRSPPEHVLESLLSLQAFFTPLLRELPSSNADIVNVNNNNPEFIYKAWLRSKFDNFVNSLINLAVSSQSDHALREVVLDTIMEFIKVGKGGRFNSAIYHKLLHTIIHSKLVVDDMILDLLVSKYFNYHDVRYFTYTSLEKLSRTLDNKSVSDDQGIIPNANSENQSSESMELWIHKIYHLLSNIPPIEGENVKSEYEMWSGLGSSVKEGNDINDIEISKPEDKAHKRQKSDEKVLSAASDLKKMKLKFTKAWISFLRLPLPLDVYKKVLVSLHQDVIPSLSNPIMLCDFLTRSYDIGGVVSVMALSSLFILMTQHGLEYPNFYEKLYALLEPSIFMEKHRAKFFELLDSCLKSPLLPAYLAAAFSKKLSRLALCVPPSGALVIIALIHNLLRRHPSINCLVHQEDGATAEDDSESKNKHSTEEIAASRNMSSSSAGIDHFDNVQANPANSNAMRSSLWEIDTLRHHYCPPVSRFVLSLENDLTVRAKTTEVAVKDFSSGSYATIFNDEIRRRVKQVPLAFYNSTPTTLFSESDFPGWTFNFKDEEATSLNDDESSDKRLSEEQDRLSAKRQRIECS